MSEKLQALLIKWKNYKAFLALNKCDWDVND